MTSIVAPAELDYFIQSLQSHQLQDIGTQSWFNLHEIVLKLNQQAYVDAATNQEELVKELIVVHGKLPTLVHEIYCVLVWRLRILPKLPNQNGNSNSNFMIYTVMFHEATAVSLIEVVLFHQNGCEALGDSSLDLIDYCIQAITQLIGLVNMMHEGQPVKIEETAWEELERQQRDISYKIGLRCLSILGYIVDKLDLLSLGAVTRLIEVHDTPCLLSEILYLQPWRRRSPNGIEKLIDDKWTIVYGDNVLKLTKIEAQTWLCFRQLLFNGNVARRYSITEFRQRELGKCQGMLNEQILDQLPPLTEFKHYLCTLQLSQTKDKGSVIMLEELPQIKDSIIAVAKRIGIKTIIEQHTQIFLNQTHDDIMAMAKQLNTAYNTDLWEKQEDTSEKVLQSSTNVCATCNKPAEKKCFQCKSVYYCDRKCQVDDWPNHKIICGK